MLSGKFIPDPVFFAGSKGQKGTGSRIRVCNTGIMNCFVLGITADTLLKQQYGGLAASHLIGPGSDILLERERQIALDRDRQLR
jgi:hypothetical protein